MGESERVGELEAAANELEARLVMRSLAEGDPTSWFDEYYRAGAAGQIVMPWSRTAPHALLAQWTAETGLNGTGLRALVVGCALGADAEHLAALGYETTGFDISETAILQARARYPGSRVRYEQADLLDPPESWDGAFDLVVEIITIQAMPRSVRAAAIRNVASFVAPAGTLLGVAWVDEGASPDDDPLAPWPLTRADIESFADHGLEPVSVAVADVPDQPDERRWLAQFRRP